jgi:hypothetical protein
MSYFNSDGAFASTSTAGTVIVASTSSLVVDTIGQLDSRDPVVEQYDSGTAASWTKPSGPHWVRIELWGGGGSGGNGTGSGPGS